MTLTTHPISFFDYTAVLREAWATLPESSSRPLPATLAQSRNLAHASLKTAVLWQLGLLITEVWQLTIVTMVPEGVGYC